MLWVNEQWLWRETIHSVDVQPGDHGLNFTHSHLLTTEALRGRWDFFFSSVDQFFQVWSELFSLLCLWLEKSVIWWVNWTIFQAWVMTAAVWLEHFMEDAWHKLWLTLSLLKSVCLGNQAELFYLYSQWLLSLIVGCISPTVRVGMTLALLHSYWISIRSFTSFHWQLEETVSCLKSWKRI